MPMAEPPVEGEGDYSLWLWEVAPEGAERATLVCRFGKASELDEAAERLMGSGRFSYSWLGKWNYDTQEDDKVDELWANKTGA